MPGGVGEYRYLPTETRTQFVNLKGFQGWSRSRVNRTRYNRKFTAEHRLANDWAWMRAEAKAEGR